MTTKPVAPRGTAPFEFPDPPEREPDDMTGFNHLTTTGSVHYLIQHLGNPDTTLVAGEHYLSPVPTGDLAGVRYPDLLVAFGVNPAAYYRSNAYVISEQGKPPDFVLEIASRKTGRSDVREKRDDYAALGIPEYWRFDETGRFHGARLAGDRLADGAYTPIPVEELPDGNLRGYSAVLNLWLRWQDGRLEWHDPATGQPILTYRDHQAIAETERQARAAVRAELDAERQARRELEQELQRLRNQ